MRAGPLGSSKGVESNVRSKRPCCRISMATREWGPLQPLSRRQRLPGQPRAPHRHHCFRLRRLRRFGRAGCTPGAGRPSEAAGPATASLPGATTSPTRERAMTHSFHSRSVTAGSAWRRSASSRRSSTRRRAVSSRCSSSPTTYGILDLHQSNDTTRHHCHETADPMPDQRERSPQARKDNNLSHSAGLCCRTAETNASPSEHVGAQLVGVPTGCSWAGGEVAPPAPA